MQWPEPADFGQTGGKIEDIQQSPHLFDAEGVAQSLALMLPGDYLGRVAAQIVCFHGTAEIGTDEPQSRIDIAGRAVLLDQVLHAHLDERVLLFCIL